MSVDQGDLFKAWCFFNVAHRPHPREMLMASCGQIATAVGMGPLKGMSREMIFIRTGLALGLISPVNDPMAPMLAPQDHGMGDQAASDAMTANLR